MIQSKPATPEYRDGWDRIFAKPLPARWPKPGDPLKRDEVEFYEVFTENIERSLNVRR